MKISIIFFLSLFLLAPLACDDDSNNNSNPKTNEEFLELLEDKYLDGYCSYLDRCPQADGEEWMTSESSCRAVMGELLLTEGLQQMRWALENGATYNVDNLNTCMATLDGASCDVDLNQIAACDRVLEGTLAEDAECSSSWQCASGYCNTDESCPGFCEATVGAGEECDDDEQCDAGLECDWDLEIPVCAAPAAKADQGEECEWNDQCKYGLFCLVTDFQTYVGVCQPWLEQGDVCDGDGAMDVVCEPGLGCSSTSGECEPVVINGIGEECDDELLLCDLSEHAVCAESMTSSVCTKIPGNGETCMEDYCWPGSYCGEDNICHTALQNDAACTDHDQCISGFCDEVSDTCVFGPCGPEEVNYNNGI